MSIKYEVQFIDGLGNWRRWSLVSTMEAAERSRARLVDRLGIEFLTRVRVVARGL